MNHDVTPQSTGNQGRSRARNDTAPSKATRVKLTWRPVVAGVLEIMASTPYFLASLTFFLFPARMKDADTYMTGATTPGVAEVWAPVGLVMWLPFALPLAVGGACALVRKGWDLAFLGPIVPLFLTVLSVLWGNIALTAFGSLFASAGSRQWRCGGRSWPLSSP
jgi:hypothetical protein